MGHSSVAEYGVLGYTTLWIVFGANDMRRRSLDSFVLPQDVTLWIVLAAAVGLILGIVVRALRAERKREQEEANKRSADEPPQPSS
jgi:membrane protein implicated in regulation of membrane protease activity